MGFREIGIKFKCALIGGYRVIEFALSSQRNTKIEMAIGEKRIDAERRTQVSDALVQSARGEAEDGQIAEHEVIFNAGCDEFAVSEFRSLDIPGNMEPERFLKSGIARPWRRGCRRDYFFPACSTTAF